MSGFLNDTTKFVNNALVNLTKLAASEALTGLSSISDHIEVTRLWKLIEKKLKKKF